MSNRRRLTTADVLQELALHSNSSMEPSDTNESADCFGHWIRFRIKQVEGETSNQPSTSTGPHILMKNVCLQSYAPLQNGHNVATMTTTIQFPSLKRVMPTV